MKLSDTGTVSRSVTRLCLGHFSFKQRSDTLFCFSDRLYTLESLTWRLNNYIADYSVSDQTKMAIHIGQVIRYKTLIDSIFTIFNTLMEFQVNSPGSTKYYWIMRDLLWSLCQISLEFLHFTKPYGKQSFPGILWGIAGTFWENTAMHSTFHFAQI